MAEISTPHGAERQRVFISYSRADRSRVEGLVLLLKALGHDVFIDYWSILPGQPWEDTLHEALQAADVLLVFWTRHAAQSEWVWREYESFDSRFPHRLLVPMRGDRTPLTATLQAHQSPDFCPLLNELFETVRDLTEKHVSKRQIRAVVLRRLQEEGIKLPRDKRHLLFGLFGILPWAMVPLYCLQCGRDRLVDFLQRKGDRLVDKTSTLIDEMIEKFTPLPAAYYYTAGVAITAGFIACQTGFGVGSLERPFIEFIKKIRAEAVTGRIPVVEVINRIIRHDEKAKAVPVPVDEFIEKIQAEAAKEGIPVTEVINRIIHHDEEGKARPAKLLQQPELFPVDVHLDQSGNDACDSQGMICVSVSRTRIEDQNHKFFGSSTPPCSAKVIRESSFCPRAFQTEYALTGVVLRRSPKADAGVQDLSRDKRFCLGDEKGKQGIYQFANCVKP